MKVTTTREITTKECPWLRQDIPAGSTFFEYLGRTYGAVSATGIAVSVSEGKRPFFEIPANAVKKGGGE